MTLLPRSWPKWRTNQLAQVKNWFDRNVCSLKQMRCVSIPLQCKQLVAHYWFDQYSTGSGSASNWKSKRLVILPHTHTISQEKPAKRKIARQKNGYGMDTRLRIHHIDYHFIISIFPFCTNQTNNVPFVIRFSPVYF